MSDRLLVLSRFKELTERLLPARACTERWPIRLDHCFKRICLDNAFEDVWYRHLPRPAERHIAEPALSRAVAIAEQIYSDGLPLLARLNRNSLTWRGKRESPTVSKFQHHRGEA